MKVLVTGGSGMIGGFLISGLKDRHEFVVFDKSARPEGMQVEYCQGDLLNYDEVDKALEGVEAIVHLGAFASISEEDPILQLDVNVKGTYNLLEAAANHNIKTVIFASSACAYGFVADGFVPDYFPIDEEYSCQPKDTYGFSKVAGEEICKYYSRRYGINTVILRFSVVIDVDRGIYFMHDEDTKSGIGWAYIDVRDVVEIIRLSLDSRFDKAEIFNVVMDGAFSQTDTLTLLRKYYPTSDLSRIEKLCEKDSMMATYSNAKAKRMLGFKPKYTFGDYSQKKEKQMWEDKKS